MSEHMLDLIRAQILGGLVEAYVKMGMTGYEALLLSNQWDRRIEVVEGK